MLRVTLLGNLGADPEVRYTAKGTQVVSFRVAVNQVKFGPDGERQENTEWFRVSVFGTRAEYAQRLTKGNRVLVVGRLDIGKYQSRDGETRTSFDVRADDVQVLGGPRMGAAEGEPMDVEAEAEPALAGVSSLSAPRANGRPARSAPSAPAKSDDLEDLPF